MQSTSQNFTSIVNDLLTDRTESVEGIEILNTYGNTHGINFTEKDLDEILANFNKHKDFIPNIKVDHSTQQLLLKEIFKNNKIPSYTEIPNAGHVSKLYKKGQSLFANFAGIPKKVKPLLFNGQFKSISPEIYLNFRGQGKKFLKAVALTNIPSLNHISNVHMSENNTEGGDNQGLYFSGQINIIDEVANMNTNTDQSVQNDQTAVTYDDLHKFSENLFDKFKGFFSKSEKEEKKSTEQLNMSEVESMISDKIKPLLNENNDLKNRLIDKENEVKKFSERITDIEKFSRKETVNAICKQAELDGVPPAILKKAKPLLLSEKSGETIMLSQEVDNKVIEVEKSITEVVKDIFNELKGSIDFSERTHGSMVSPGSPELDDEDSVMFSEAEKIASEKMKAGLAEYEAWDQAISEAAQKGRR